jgi:diamine N-acetyltransferase
VKGDDQMINFREITEENLFDVIKLSDSLDDYQKRCVAPNIVSIAQAYVNKRAWPRAIYHKDELVGFMMLALFDEDIDEKDQPAYYVWRFMIAKEHQNKGYGKAALDLILEKAKNEGQKYVYLSCEMEGAMPYQFYIKYGFVDTNTKDDGEEILKYKL